MNSKIASGLLIIALSLAGCGSTPPDTEDLDSGPTVVETPNRSEQLGPLDGGGVSSDPSMMDNTSRAPTYEDLLKVTTLFFDFDSSSLRTDHQNVIAAHARFLSENPHSKLRLEGHADERGSREYNIGLGERRAQSVRKAMSLSGAATSQLSTLSYGEEKPLDPGHDEFAWNANRRVQLVYH